MEGECDLVSNHPSQLFDGLRLALAEKKHGEGVRGSFVGSCSSRTRDWTLYFAPPDFLLCMGSRHALPSLKYRVNCAPLQQDLPGNCLLILILQVAGSAFLTARHVQLWNASSFLVGSARAQLV